LFKLFDIFGFKLLLGLAFGIFGFDVIGLFFWEGRFDVNGRGFDDAGCLLLILGVAFFIILIFFKVFCFYLFFLLETLFKIFYFFLKYLKDILIYFLELILNSLGPNLFLFSNNDIKWILNYLLKNDY
jgi:hypothetical protein